MNLRIEKKKNVSWEKRKWCFGKSILVLWFLTSLLQSSLLFSKDFFASDNPKVTRALQKTFGNHLPGKFQRLAGGFSSPGIYKLSVHKNSYVLRFSHPNRSLADEKRTLTCMRLSAEKEISPSIRYANLHDRIVIMDFIKPVPLPRKDFSPELLIRLALTVRKLHDGTSFPKFLSPFAVRRKFEESLKSYKSNLIKLVSYQLEKIETILEKQKISCPTHNDLKPENILFDGMKFWFIDWEASCQGDPYFDLATIIIFYAFDTDQENLFLRAYFGNAPTDFQQAKLYMMKQSVMGYYGTAYLMVSKSKNTPALSRDEIEKLPTLEDYFKHQSSRKNQTLSYQELQEFGWILLKEVLVNTKSEEFRKSILKLNE